MEQGAYSVAKLLENRFSRFLKSLQGPVFGARVGLTASLVEREAPTGEYGSLLTGDAAQIAELCCVGDRGNPRQGLAAGFAGRGQQFMWIMRG